MPDYDFRCIRCGYTQTHKYSPNRNTLPDKIYFAHPDCKHRTLARVYGVPNVTNVNRFGTRSKRDTGKDKK